MLERFTVRIECIDGGEAFDLDFTKVSKYISDAEIAREIDKVKEYDPDINRTVEGTKRAIHAVQTVVDRFFYGFGGLGGLEDGVAERMNYLNSVFSNPAKIKWWVQNVAACGAPDFVCVHTREEVHLYCLNSRQIAAYVRTGYNAKDGTLPAKFHHCLVLGEF